MGIERRWYATHTTATPAVYLNIYATDSEANCELINSLIGVAAAGIVIIMSISDSRTSVVLLKPWATADIGTT